MAGEVRRRTGMTVLVMGANGFLGSRVTRQLVAAGDDVDLTHYRPEADGGGGGDPGDDRYAGGEQAATAPQEHDRGGEGEEIRSVLGCHGDENLT